MNKQNNYRTNSFKIPIIYGQFVFFTFVLILSTITLEAQEQLHFATAYSQQRNTKSTKTIKLPFFDDFSDYSGRPKEELWDNSTAFVNNTLMLNPPSAGVASLDAYDASGKIYDAATATNSFKADNLTSQAIDLSTPDTKDVYFSFFYQPQGIANAPEVDDSLVLQFYMPDKNTWQTVWFALGSKVKDFEYIILPVNNSEYLKKGFRFRFYNYCSFSSSTSSSTVTDVDFWHIDYVYLNKNRTIIDNVFRDIAIVKSQNNYLKKYSSVPWKDYLQTQNLTTDSFSIELINNDNSGRKIKERMIYMTESVSGDSIAPYQLGAVNINAQEKAEYQFKFPFTFKDNGFDSAIFNITTTFITDDYDKTVNNTFTTKQIFKDYYAYDDGSSEASYGLLGEGSRNAMFAYEFTPLKSSYLNAVDMYFNYSLNQGYVKPFYLCVWNAKGGKPNEIIFRKEGVKPQYSAVPNQFIRYELGESIEVSDTFFVGWIQTASVSANIGYDINNNASAHIFYNIDGSWQPSALSGSVMMRPVVGSQLSTIKQNEVTNFFIYPNPAQNSITIKNIEVINKEIAIYNLSGKCVLHQKLVSPQINVSNLQNGLYFLKIFDKNNFLGTQKLIIQN